MHWIALTLLNWIYTPFILILDCLMLIDISNWLILLSIFFISSHLLPKRISTSNFTVSISTAMLLFSTSFSYTLIPIVPSYVLHFFSCFPDISFSSLRRLWNLLLLNLHFDQASFIFICVHPPLCGHSKNYGIQDPHIYQLRGWSSLPSRCFWPRPLPFCWPCGCWRQVVMSYLHTFWTAFSERIIMYLSLLLLIRIQ